jgi:hypothetical protein
MLETNTKIADHAPNTKSREKPNQGVQEPTLTLQDPGSRRYTNKGKKDTNDRTGEQDMAVNLAIDDHLEIDIYCTMDQQVAQTKRYLNVNSVGGVATLENQIAALTSVISGGYESLLSDQASFYGIRVRDITGPTPSYWVTHESTVSGMIAGDPLPKQTCGLLRLFAEDGTRRDQNRIYVPFPGGDANTSPSGRPSAAYIADLDLLALIFTGLIAINDGAGNSSSLDFGILKSGPARIESYVAHVPGRQWATQRRRGDYGAFNSLPF